MDTCQHDAQMAQPERRFAELERRLADVEADNRCLRADNKRLKAEVLRLTERLAQYEPRDTPRDGTPGYGFARPSDYGLEGETKRRQRLSRRRNCAAKRAAADGRLAEAGRKQRVAELEGRLCDLCRPYWQDTTPAMNRTSGISPTWSTMVRLLLAEELFTFVLVPKVAPTNNDMERQLRSPAQDRKAGRTSKTAEGAHRRSVVVSVLESLRANLETFTPGSVLDEVGRRVKKASVCLPGNGRPSRRPKPASPT